MSSEKDMEKEKGILKKQIIQFMEEQEGQAIEVSDISKGLGRSGSKAFKEMVKAIAQLEREEKMVLLPSGKFKLTGGSTAMQGRFSGNERGFGFVSIDEYESDIFIPPTETRSALNGDLVKVEVTQEAIPSQDKGPAGRVIEILERGTTVVFGEFQPYTDDEVEEMNLYGFITPHNQKLPNVLVKIEAKGIRPAAGSIVQVELTQYNDTQAGTDLKGIVTNTIGHKDEPGIEILTIVHKYDIPTEFPEAVIQEADAVPDTIAEEETKGRKDLRDEMIITIDGADAKDLDDAVQVKKLDNGNYYLGVHIADVSHYVTEDSAMDQEALERGTSVYLTDRVIPMLPQRLSNGICSLHPHVDRLTLSCEMEIDRSGNVVDYTISPSIINSHHRMTYAAVNQILMDKDEEVREEYSEITDMLEQMEELHHILEKRREQRGSIDFDTREAKIEVDPQGMPVDILLRERGVGERLIESFMLEANETVSEHFATRRLPILYRIHDRPDEGKMQRFIEFVSSFGIEVKGTKDTISPLLLQDILNKVKGKPEEGVISMLLLRSMQQAKYDVEPIGHYGLAADFYSHFTSPIRRYPDLILHRLIHYYTEVDSSQKAVNRWAAKLPDIAEHSSVTERRAVDAERETDELKKTEYMLSKLGETFEGVVTSVTNFGMFVQLDNSVEGLIHMSNLNDDYYEFIERDLLLVGRRTGKIFRIGQTVTIKVIGADTDNYKIDFELVPDESQETVEQKDNDKKSKKGRFRKRTVDRKKGKGRRKDKDGSQSQESQDKKGRFKRRDKSDDSQPKNRKKGRRKTKKSGKKRK